MQVQTATLAAHAPAARRAAAVLLGTALVAAAAQVSVPLPGTPVPMTLQPLAVLIVGGLLGPSLGAASLLCYLALGAAGAPVFTPSPVLPPGVGRLLGPTGGYLLAYPLAAYAVGRVTGDPKGHGGKRLLRVAAAVLAGLALIHLGGLAQLILITGSAAQAARFGTLPFLLGDVGKLVLAALILRHTVSPVRARL
jgi:biotin transport system substrate-specific component